GAAVLIRRGGPGDHEPAVARAHQRLDVELREAPAGLRVARPDAAPSLRRGGAAVAAHVDGGDVVRRRTPAQHHQPAEPLADEGGKVDRRVKHPAPATAPYSARSK